MKKQKHAVRIIYNKDKFTHSKPLMRDMNALNVYQINIFQVLKFMYKSKHNLNPRVFDNTFTEIHHGYPTRFSRSNFKQPKIITKTTSFAISSRGPKIWNNYLLEFEKNNLSLPLFLYKLKIKLLESEDKLAFFWQSKLQLILILSLMCFFTIGIFKYGCAYKLAYISVYIYFVCIYIYRLYAFIHTFSFVCVHIYVYIDILYLFTFWWFLVIRLLKHSSSFQLN